MVRYIKGKGAEVSAGDGEIYKGEGGRGKCW